MTTRNPSTGPAGQEVWRNLAQISDLFRAVAARREPRKDLSRTTVSRARIFGCLFRHGSSGEPVRDKTPAHDLAVSPGEKTIWKSNHGKRST